MRQIVLDLETQRGFAEVGGPERFSDLGVSLVGVYDYGEERFNSFGESELGKLEELLSRANRVIGFNIRRFDFPVLQPHLKRLKLAQVPTLDLLEEIEKITGHRVSLQSLSQGTLGEGKSGSGLDALEFYRKGEIERLRKYCLDDVRLTREVYEFGKKFQKVYFMSRDGSQRIEISVGWKDPEPPSNLPLF